MCINERQLTGNEQISNESCYIDALKPIFQTGTPFVNIPANHNVCFSSTSK